MKTVLFSLLLLTGSRFSNTIPDLDLIRRNFALAPNDKDVCRSMIAQLKTSRQPVGIAYFGAFQMMWARHVSNPFSKLASFNQGKKTLEKAMVLSPNNVEIVFIRHSIQRNSPSFLGYKDDLHQDHNFLYHNLSRVSSPLLKMQIVHLLKAE